MTTTNFFTEMARRGLQEQTNWASNTYKTLLSVSSGAGLVAAIVGPTAGGAETTTFEVTVDGVVSTLVVAGLASGSRAVLTAAMVAAKDPYNDGFAEAGMILAGGEALDANKQVFTATPTAASILLPWAAIQLTAVPCLRFSKSLLIRAKHSASITNSTATAYSAVQYRLGL